MIDEKGNIIDGDRVIAVCARLLKAQGRLTSNRVTATVMSNIGFHKAMEESGIDVDVTGVGDRYVLEQMLRSGCVLGGEQSGHIIFREFTTTGDGMLSSLQFMNAVLTSGKTVSELAGEIKKKYSADPEVAKAIEDIESAMAGNGRVLIRPSGTEPLVRVMLEGDDEERLLDLARSLADLIEAKFM